MHELFKENIKEFLLSNNIDIHNPHFKESENYQKIKDTRILGSAYGSMSIGEFIERFLLTSDEVSNTYESEYDLGATADLIGRCEDRDVAREIITLIRSIPEKDIDTETEEFVNKFYRPDGLIDRLKKYLNFDLDAFDKTSKKYKYERCKILYFFYMLEHDYIPATNVLLLLSKPSMENIDNSPLHMQSYNGMTIELIKESLEKELSLPVKAEINKCVKEIVTLWDKVLANSQILMDFFCDTGCEYDFEETIKLLSSGLTEQDAKCTPQYTLSPMETLYLKVVQHEYLGNIIDVSLTNEIQNHYVYNVPSEYIEEMKKLHYSSVDINNVEQYIEENAKRISKYVYLKENTSKEEVRRIRSYKQKIRKWIDFCFRAKPLLNIKDISNELQIISFLQAVILDNQNETFPYTFHGYQNHMKHMPQVQGALKNNKYVINALQCYWVRKVTDHWYANIGRLNERNKVRKLEQVCDNILTEILSKPNLAEMKTMQNYYLNKLDDGLITTTEQIEAVQHLRDYLYNKGFNYIDHYLLIRYAFLYPPEINGTYMFLTNLINMAIKDHTPNVQASIETHSADGKDKMLLDLKLDLDYQEKECILDNLNIRDIRP